MEDNGLEPMTFWLPARLKIFLTAKNRAFLNGKNKSSSECSSDILFDSTKTCICGNSGSAIESKFLPTCRPTLQIERTSSQSVD
jgi:hypothetical protein